VELRDRPGLPRLQVLQVETPDQVVFAPDVLGDQVNLHEVIKSAIIKTRMTFLPEFNIHSFRILKQTFPTRVSQICT
jgi:hypothetical protein